MKLFEQLRLAKEAYDDTQRKKAQLKKVFSKSAAEKTSADSKVMKKIFDIFANSFPHLVLLPHYVDPTKHLSSKAVLVGEISPTRITAPTKSRSNCSLGYVADVPNTLYRQLNDLLNKQGNHFTVFSQKDVEIPSRIDKFTSCILVASAFGEQFDFVHTSYNIFYEDDK